MKEKKLNFLLDNKSWFEEDVLGWGFISVSMNSDLLKKYLLLDVQKGEL